MRLKPSAELVDMAKRLESDYQARITELGGSFFVWANSVQVGIEIQHGGRLGRHWRKSTRYARRLVPFGKPIVYKRFDQAETELQDHLEHWIERTRGR
jgi:hypothetical protein